MVERDDGTNETAGSDTIEVAVADPTIYSVATVVNTMVKHSTGSDDDQRAWGEVQAEFSQLVENEGEEAVRSQIGDLDTEWIDRKEDVAKQLNAWLEEMDS